MTSGLSTRLLLTLSVVLVAATSAMAQTFEVINSAVDQDPIGLAWSGLHFGTGAAERATAAGLSTSDQTPTPVAFEYSDGYRTRNKIHHIASFAMLPLFATEVYVGQKMFNDPSSITPGMRHFHGTIALAITGLFAVYSVTGVWNLIEARKDPNGHTRRTVHGILMLVGEAGFFATTLVTPNHHTQNGSALDPAKKDQHLALAYVSISVSTAGYVMMLFR
jgi:hypothetical protein